MARRSQNDEGGVKIVAQNRKARHDYQIIETIEAGLVLTGPEIKSIRNGKITLAGSFVSAYNNELFLIGAHIEPYLFDTSKDYDPLRKRKLLMNRYEILRISSQLAEKGLTAVPLDVHLRKGRAKLEVAIAKGKSAPDKRESVKARESKREIDRAMKGRR